MDLLREIKQRFEVKRGEQARLPSIELPYLHTEGAAEDPAAAVVAVALALGKDFSRLADVPVHLEELFALESVSMDSCSWHNARNCASHQGSEPCRIKSCRC